MLNILLSVVLLNVSVIAFYYTFRINRVEQVMNSFEPGIINTCVYKDINQRYYFQKEEVLNTVKYYFSQNLNDIEHSLKIAFREDNKNTEFSDTPNIVQIDLYANIIFDGIYAQNVRFILNGREVSKDWRSTF